MGKACNEFQAEHLEKKMNILQQMLWQIIDMLCVTLFLKKILSWISDQVLFFLLGENVGPMPPVLSKYVMDT